MPKSFDDELASTLRTIHSLRARSQDELEDYFHDAIVKTLKQGKDVSHWLGYIYKTVYLRISCGQEEREHLQLKEEIVPHAKPIDIALKIDIERAIAEVHPRGQIYLYEYFYEGRTTEEIAGRYSVASQAVSKSIQRGLIVMRGVLEKDNI